MYGDFQTPPELAEAVMAAVEARTGVRPRSILEPTCGTGGLLAAARARFAAPEALGVEISGSHLCAARVRLADPAVRLERADFFAVDWDRVLARLPEPILVVGNPPWVTNAAQGAVGADNLPVKVNAAGLRGIEALTGRSNFDISEWMIRHLLERLPGRRAVLAMLCKTAVARKILDHAWAMPAPPRRCAIHRIDARRCFAAAVDACLLVVEVSPGDGAARECSVHSDLGSTVEAVWAMRAGGLVSDARAYDRGAWLHRPGGRSWRSGVKHDCAKLLELHATTQGWLNGLGESVEVEPSAVFPLLKSSDLGRGVEPRRWLLLPYRSTGEQEAELRARSPAAWSYLDRHAAQIGARRSAIYRGRPRFAVFGVGPYTFAGSKVAISGLHKTLSFRPVGLHQGRPVVLDDTAYLRPCPDGHAQRVLMSVLESEPVQALLQGLIFWDAKRPVTARVLNAIDLVAAARAIGFSEVEAGRLGDPVLTPAAGTSGPRGAPPSAPSPGQNGGATDGWPRPSGR